ncbi:MAG TPA: hypothetical protein VJT67_16795 [Longimicrobiaceae bacterium]|nr:hypothetical protein [Longimicrobiaceae bacterium]
MNPYSSDQNGHNRPEDRFEYARKRAEIPVDVLREFARDKFDVYTQRGLAAMVALSQGAVSDFVLGRSEPVRRTVVAFADLYLVFYPEGYVAERKVEREVLPQLKAVLPPGEDAALDTVEAMIQAAEDAGVFDEAPERLRHWLTTVVSAEYEAERRYKEFERKRRKKGTAPESRPRRHKDGPPGETGSSPAKKPRGR